MIFLVENSHASTDELRVNLQARGRWVKDIPQRVTGWYDKHHDSYGIRPGSSQLINTFTDQVLFDAYKRIMEKKIQKISVKINKDYANSDNEGVQDVLDGFVFRMSDMREDLLDGFSWTSTEWSAWTCKSFQQPEYRVCRANILRYIEAFDVDNPICWEDFMERVSWKKSTICNLQVQQNGEWSGEKVDSIDDFPAFGLQLSFHFYDHEYIDRFASYKLRPYPKETVTEQTDSKRPRKDSAKKKQREAKKNQHKKLADLRKRKTDLIRRVDNTKKEVHSVYWPQFKGLSTTLKNIKPGEPTAEDKLNDAEEMLKMLVVLAAGQL